MTGYLLGLFSSAAFGLIPLFTLPLTASGASVGTALFYRFFIATLLLLPCVLPRREELRQSPANLCKLGGLSFCYILAVLFFFHSFSFMPSGITATVQFLYPVMVMLIMIGAFHERFSPSIGISLILAVAGVALLSWGASDGAVPSANYASGEILLGIALSLLAGLANGLYFIGIKMARIQISDLAMTFYVMLFGSIFCFINALCMSSLQWLASGEQLSLAVGLALVTAVLSNLALIAAIRRVGPTVTSILGVMEPLTAVGVGTIIFKEPFTLSLAVGIALIIISVLLILIAPFFAKAKNFSR